MDVAPTLAEQLQSLDRLLGPDTSAAATGGCALSVQIDRLGREVVAVVPSCVAVSIAVSRLGIDAVVALPVARAGVVPGATEVRSSLALSLPAASVSCVVVLQASAPKAFAVLAEDLTGLLCSAQQPPELDAHLVPLTASTGGALAGSLAEMRLLDRALGVLIGQGWSPEMAQAELYRRSAVAGLTVLAVAERLLASTSAAAPHHPD